jgi:preprotein translocase subunit SecG
MSRLFFPRLLSWLRVKKFKNMIWLKILQLIVAILMMLSILLQNKGSAVSGLFGGSGNVYMTKRGLDKILFFSTIVLSVVFFGLSLAMFII